MQSSRKLSCVYFTSWWINTKNVVFIARGVREQRLRFCYRSTCSRTLHVHRNYLNRAPSNPTQNLTTKNKNRGNYKWHEKYISLFCCFGCRSHPLFLSSEKHWSSPRSNAIGSDLAHILTKKTTTWLEILRNFHEEIRFPPSSSPAKGMDANKLKVVSRRGDLPGGLLVSLHYLCLETKMSSKFI